jgi:transposase
VPAKWNENTQRFYSEPYSDVEIDAQRRQILALRAEGKDDKTVAAEIGVTVATVKRRLRRAEEMDAKNPGAALKRQQRTSDRDAAAKRLDTVNLDSVAFTAELWEVFDSGPAMIIERV